MRLVGASFILLCCRVRAGRRGPQRRLRTGSRRVGTRSSIERRRIGEDLQAVGAWSARAIARCAVVGASSSPRPTPDAGAPFAGPVGCRAPGGGSGSNADGFGSARRRRRAGGCVRAVRTRSDSGGPIERRQSADDRRRPDPSVPLPFRRPPSHRPRRRLRPPKRPCRPLRFRRPPMRQRRLQCQRPPKRPCRLLQFRLPPSANRRPRKPRP